MYKVLAFSVASVLLLMMISPSEAQSFVENDRAGMEGETLTFIARLGNLDNSGKISATALTVAAFQAKYPELEVPCGIDQEKAAEENDFNGGSTLLEIESQAGMDVSVQIEITEDEREELDEIFLVILETESDNGLQPLMVEVNKTVCAVGRILESDRDAVSIRLDETLFNRTEDAGSVNLIIVRNGATELTEDVLIEATPCRRMRDGLGELSEGEDIVISTKAVTLPPTDEEMTEYRVPVEIISDDIPETDECLTIKLVGSNIQGPGQADIIIVDDDDITVGFTESAVSVREGQTIEVCAAILEPLGEISNQLTIELDITPLPASDGKIQVTYPFPMEPKFVLYATLRRECANVTAIEDEKLERSLTFGIKISTMEPRVTVEPDVVMVTIADNDGTPNRPEVTEVKLVNDDKDLFIMWGIEEDDRRPVDGYRGTVTERKPQENRRQTESKAITFESEDKEQTVQGIDAQKRYEIEICARNEFGFNCSVPFLFPFAISGRPILPTEESGGLPTGAIIAIVIILVLLLLCCLLLLLFLLFYCRKERSKNYYPEKNEKKYTEEYERYREQNSRSPSLDSEFKFEFD